MKIRVLSYNIHKGFNIWKSRRILSGIKEGIQTTNADIVLLQEVVGGPTETQFEILADTVWSHWSYGKNASFPDRHYGNAILSSFPIIKEENINISNHRFEKRGLLHCELQLPNDKKMHVFNIHLDLLHSGRMRQIERIIDRVQSHVPEEEIFIMGGDFNDWPQKISHPLHINLSLKEAFKTFRGQYAPSFPSLWPFMSLDRLYYRGLHVTAVETLTGSPWNRLSDHLPILVEFEVG